jgi:Tol biopolymer transport system component
VDPFLRLAQADTSRDFQLAPDGSRAVFFGYDGLYSVPVDGRSAARELVPEERDGPRVQAFAIDASSTRVVYTLADAEAALPRRLFSVPIDGSERPVRLSPRARRPYGGTPPGGGPADDLAGLAVNEFQLAPDGRTVLFLLQETHGDCALGCVVVTHLYVVPSDGSAPARRLASGDVRHAAFTLDSRAVVHRLTRASGAPTALLVHPLEDGASALTLHEPADAVQRLAVLADAVLFLDSPSGAAGDALFRVPLDGRRGARAVSAPLAAGRAIREFHASPDGEQVVYSANADRAGVFTLFAGPLEVERVRPSGSPPPPGVRAIGGSADVARFVFTPDSAAVLAHVASPAELSLVRVGLDGLARELSGPEGASDLALDDAGTLAMYRGAREHDTRIHVYSVPLDEEAPARQLDDFGPELGGIYSYEIHPNGREAVFAAGSRDYTFNELHRVPLDLSGPPRLVAGLVQGEERLQDHRIEPRSGRIVYRLQEQEASSYRVELYSAPLDGSGPRVRLDQGEARVLDYRFARERVLFLKSSDPALERYEVFSVLPDGSGGPQILNGPLVANGRVYDFRVSPDGTRVAYLAAQLAANRAELFSVPANGSAAAVRLNPTPVSGGEVWRGGFRISPDNTRVVFAGDLVTNNAFGLWSAPIGGGGSLALWNAPAGREVERLEVTPDSTRAVFTADGVVNGRHQLYVVPVDGSAAATPLPATSGTPKVFEFRLTPDGTRAVYVAAGLVASVPLDGSAAPVVLSAPLVAGGRIVGLPEVSSEWVLYKADQKVVRRFDLHAMPIDGSLPARRVNVPVGNDGVGSFALAGDEVLFVAPTTETHGSGALFRAPLDGSAPPRSLNPPGTYATTTSSPASFLVHPDRHRVLFAAARESVGFYPGIRLYLGFLGQPIRGAERP